MKLLDLANFNKARKFIEINARPLDKALFDYHFSGAPIDKFFSELAKYQNSDGGFAYGLEPDIRTPISTNITTTHAFQYLSKINEFPEFMNKAVDYLADNFSEKYNKWLAVNPQVNESPRAVWWNYDETKQLDDASWGNPTVEIIGYLTKFNNSFDKSKLLQLQQKTVTRLLDSDEFDFHELFCYKRFIEISGYEVTTDMVNKLNHLILKAVKKDLSKWDSYGAHPLDFVDSPSSSLYQTLLEDVNNELDYVIGKQEGDGSWLPNWEWYQYPEDWKVAKVELAGKITLDKLLKLKSFSRLSL